MFNRKTSEYTLRFTPRNIMPGAAERQLDFALARLKRVLPDQRQLSGSGKSGVTAFVQFRCADDTEAMRIADAVCYLKDHTPRFSDASLTTGLGISYRRVATI